MSKSSAPAATDLPDFPDVAWADGGGIVFDAAPLTGMQRTGDACVVCFKRWPRPGVPVGQVPNGDTVRACPACAPAVLATVHHHMVRSLLDRAARHMDRYAPDMLTALLESAPRPLDGAGRRVVDAAVVAVAKHIQQTEDLAEQDRLPDEIRNYADAHAWLLALWQTGPPAPVLREVLVNVLAGTQ